MIYLGVDPGKSGAVAAIDERGHVVRIVKNDTTERDLFDAFCGYDTDEVAGVIERVAAMPNQGVASTFKFGMSYGFLRACLIAAGVRFEEVTPPKWQTEMKCRSGGNKNITKQRAQQLFPSVKITHATADALLLAEYARKTLWVP